MPRNASFTYWACGGRPAKGSEPVPPARRDPRRRCGGVLAADGGGTRKACSNASKRCAASFSIRRSPSTRGASPGRARRTKTTGDGFLVEFASVVDGALLVEVQQAMPERNISGVVYAWIGAFDDTSTITRMS